MNKVNLHIILFLGIFLVAGCIKSESIDNNANSLEIDDFQSYSRDGYQWLNFPVGDKKYVSKKLTIKKGDLTFSLHEIPQAYFLKNKKNGSKVDSNERIFIFEIESNSHKKVIDYCQNENMTSDAFTEYLSFKMENDIFMKRGNDTTHLIGMIYEPSFSVSPKEKFVFFIKDNLKNSPFTIIYNDHLFGAGLNYFELDKNLILNKHYDI